MKALEASATDLAAWHFRHTLWEIVGRAAEELGKPDEAAAAYRHALATAPQHRPSLERLARLGGADDAERARLNALTPEVPCEMSFEGQARFMGYSLVADPLSATQGRAAETQELHVYWLIRAPLAPELRAVAQLHDASGRRLRGEALPELDSARNLRNGLSGEIVRYRYRVSAPLPAGSFVRVGLWSPEAGSEPARWLLDELGRPFTELGLPGKRAE